MLSRPDRLRHILMKHLQRAAAALLLAIGSLLTSGCTTTLVVMHVYDKMTEGDPTACRKLNSVERAFQPRCGAYAAGSLDAKDVVASGLPVCPLGLAARDPAYWQMLPELIAKGATPEMCRESPWVTLAQATPCPEFGRATAAELQSLRWLAEADSRAIHHDVVRVLSCPNARIAGLDNVLDTWVAQDQLPSRGLPFGVFGALHPSHLRSPLALTLEARGHTAAVGLGAYQGRLAPGFEEALRTGDFVALDWWLQRVPALANKAPPANGDQLPWIPLARVITPAFMPDPALQRDTVAYLLAHGADPWRPLPHEPGQTVVGLAVKLKSPLADTLAAPNALASHGGAPVAAAAAATLRAR
jgi:hypothetical protein